MTTTVLNIHEFYNELKSAGFNEQQAEVIANIQGKAASATIEQTKITFEHFKHEYKLDDIATNKSLDARAKETELKLDARIKETELKIEMVRADLTKTILTVGVGVGLTQIVAIFLLFMRMTGKA